MTQALSAVLLTPSPRITSETTPSRTIHDLPSELLLQIFSELSAPDASKMRGVCRVWQQLLNDEDLWRFFLERDFNPSPMHSSQESDQSRYILYATYVHGLYVQRTLMQHEDRVTSLVYADGVLYSASLDRSIKIWNIDTDNSQPYHKFIMNSLQCLLGKQTCLPLLSMAMGSSFPALWIKRSGSGIKRQKFA